VALGFTLLLASWLDASVTPFFFVAVMVSAWLGGWKSGLLATVLSTLAINYFLIEPLYSLQIVNVRTIVQLSMFLIAAGLISGLSQSRRTALADARANYQALKETMEREEAMRIESSQAEKALRQSEARFRAVAANLPQGAVFIVDHNLRYLLAEGKALEDADMTSEDLVGKTIWEALDPALAARYEPSYRQALNGEPFSWEHDSHDRHYISHGTPLMNDQGEVYAVLAVSYDISDRKQAEAELRQKNAILDVVNESAPTPIFVKDRQGRIIYANPATLEVLGKSAAEVIGYRDCDLYLNSEDAARVMENDQRIMESGQTEVVEESPDGVRTFLGMKAPYRNEAGEVIGLIGISNDISERVQIERARERILQQEQAARETAERANRIKDEFLAVLSHELRSPLNPILGWTRLLQNGKLDESRQREALATIERNAKLQTQLIEDLLDISRIMQGKLSLTAAPVSLTFVITAAVETVRLAAEAKAIDLRFACDFGLEDNNPKSKIQNPKYQVSGDAARLQQVVWNLLTNAVKFTPPGGRVEVKLSLVTGHSSFVEESEQMTNDKGQMTKYAQIIVRDNGKGIAPEFLPHVFEYFRQADSTTTRRFGGLGLGLAIVRQIVEMHGGTVWAESLGENQGATFVVQLPIIQQAISTISEPTHAQAENTGTPLSNLQILVVDDDADTREFQAFVLEQSGAKVTAVASGFEALQALDQFVFDVLVSDVGMAEMDGYMLIQQIRSREALRNNSHSPEQGGTILAIALTSYARDFDQQKALQAGFQAHLAKPVEPEILVGAIVNLLQENRTRELE
jgi:PAS domain S-box-containing protein